MVWMLLQYYFYQQSYWSLKFKNVVKFCVHISPIFSCLVTYVTKPRVNETPPTKTHAQNVGITRHCVPPPFIIGVTWIWVPPPFIIGSKDPFLRQLHLAVEKYYHLGASSSTWKVYRAGTKVFAQWLKNHQSPHPKTPYCCSQCIWLWKVSRPSLSRCTSQQSEVFMLDQVDMKTLQDSLLPGSNKSSRAFKKEQVIARPPRVHLPIITLDIMQGIHSVLAQQPQNYYNMMIWAACAMAFFGFLRSSEFTVPSQSQLILTLMYISACQISPWTAVTPLKWSKSTLNNLKPILFDGE